MARLRALPSMVGTLRPSVSYLPRPEDRGRVRQGTRSQKWYNSGRWKALRLEVLARDLFTCQRCLQATHDTSQLVANHRTPHKGDPILFWNRDNIECVCASCHNGVIQREERKEQHR